MRCLGGGTTEDQLLADYPQLSREDIHEALTYAANFLAAHVCPPVGPPHHGQVLNVRLLDDENLDPLIIEALSDAGHEVRTIRETNPSASDEAVIEIAQKEERVLVTEGKDFGELVYNRVRPSPGVLLVRRFPSPSQAKPHAVVEAVSRLREELVEKFIVVESGRVRISRPTAD